MKPAYLPVALAACAASPAMAESADFYRGGWRVQGTEGEIYEFVIRGTQVSGIHCTRCADGTTLSRIEGRFDDATGLTFVVRHLNPDGSLAGVDRATARLKDGKLVIAGARPQVAIKDPRGPTPGTYPQATLPPGSPPVKILPTPAGGPGPRPAPYEQPAPWRRLSASDVVGVWIGFGFGMEKQYFVVRQDRGQLFGMACGRCDNPYTFGALENFKITGDTLEFDIMHQDWGEGTVVPFARHVTAHIAMNELRMDARRADVAGGAPIIASLIGPISLEATRGNTVGR